MQFTLFLINIVVLCEAFGNYVPEIDSPNVGTVLFTRADLYNQRWSRAKIKLLQARKYFQNIIPPSHHIKTVNEEYLDNLLNYFEDSYKLVKREVNNTKLQNVMNVALSDILGGYLKLWVLPITKYAYYGGTVSMEKALNAYKVYENIKRSLNTDGQNWRLPNENLLRSVAIDVISRPRVTFTRSMGDPSKSLAFYEKSDSGLKIPMPMINWNIFPASMVLPLKNKSLIPITSPSSSNMLLNYFDIAENCMKTQDVNNLKDFNMRFQAWLAANVAPHLNDDNLYIAFGNILSVMNTTKRFCEKILCSTCDDNHENLKIDSNTLSSYSHSFHKKYIFIAIILFIELVWCIPSLLYLLRLRKIKRNKGVRGFFFKLFKRKPTYNVHKISKSSQSDIFEIDGNGNYTPGKGCGVKLILKPKTKILENDVQCSYDSKYTSAKSSKTLQKQNNSDDRVTIVNEVPIKSSLKKSLPKILSEFDNPSNLKQDSDIIKTKPLSKFSQIRTQLNTCYTEQKLETSRINTELADEKTIKEVNYSQDNTLRSMESEPKLKCEYCISIKNAPHKSKTQCSCTCCLIDKKDKNTSMKYAANEPKTQFLKSKQNEKKAKKIELRSQVLKKSTKLSKSKMGRDADKNIKDSDKPLLRIRIERPETEIRVGITSVRESVGSSRRPSKIPRLVATSSKQTIQKEEKAIKLSSKLKTTTINSSLIQKKDLIKGRAVDDIVLQKRVSEVDKKLNITL